MAAVTYLQYYFGDMSKQINFTLREQDIPTQWYNLLADFPEPLPHRCIRAPNSRFRRRHCLRSSRKISSNRKCVLTAGCRFPKKSATFTHSGGHAVVARGAVGEGAQNTGTHLLQYEGVSPAGSHKVNTSVAQAYFNKVAGTKRLATETGAGQWGSSLALACKLFGLECNVYMVKVSYQQKPYRACSCTLGARRCIPAPATRPNTGARCSTTIRIAPAASASP